MMALNGIKKSRNVGASNMFKKSSAMKAAEVDEIVNFNFL